MVNAVPDFAEQPKVINGFSDLRVEVFGDRGRHGREAVGMGPLPGNIAVEIEMIVEMEDQYSHISVSLYGDPLVVNTVPSKNLNLGRTMSFLKSSLSSFISIASRFSLSLFLFVDLGITAVFLVRE